VFSNVRNSLLPSSSHTLQMLTRISETPSATGDAKYRHIYIVDMANRIPTAKSLKQCCLRNAIPENNSFLDMSTYHVTETWCHILYWRTRQERRGSASCIWTIIHY